MSKDANCRLFCGDFLDGMAKLADRSVHAVLTDHPFGSTDLPWDQRVDLAAWWREVDRVTTETAVVASFAAQPFATDLINSNRKAFRYELVWDKVAPVGFLNARRQPMRVHELFLVFCRRPGNSIYVPQMRPGKQYVMRKAANRGSVYNHHGAHVTVNTGTRHPLSILSFPKPHHRERRHPTERPLSLCEWIVLSYTRPGTTVLDSFMGSAPFGEAALKHGRNFIGIERDQAIFATAANRVLPLMNARSRSHLERQLNGRRS